MDVEMEVALSAFVTLWFHLYLGYVWFLNLFFKKLFFKFFYVCLLLKKMVNEKYFPVKEKFNLVSKKIFSWKFFSGKHFPEIVKNLEMSYYLLIISNLVLKLLIAINIYIYIYILFSIFIFQFHLLKFNFYINFSPHFYNCYLLFPYHFFIEIFYVSNLVLILLIVTYFIWNNLWNINYYYFNFFIFQFFFIF